MTDLPDKIKHEMNVRIKPLIIIIDRDLGNYGLYKSILASEYDLLCVNSIEMAAKQCGDKKLAAIVIDGCFDVDEADSFYKTVKEQYREEKPILLVIEEPSNKDSIISYLCIGAKEYIPKPFTKEGITGTIRDQLKKWGQRRKI